MADPVFKDSSYKFTDPIRYFKANDPYYWEVENIPLKQIHSNMLWLKDQIGPQDRQFADVGRRDLSELKPYANGEDNVIRVKPGRYTARINDAYKIDPLAFFEKIIGEDFGFEDRWKGKLLYHADILPVMNRFKERIQANFLGLNGLETRVFSYPVQTVDKAHKDWIRGHSSTGEYTGPHLKDRDLDRYATAFPLTDGGSINSSYGRGNPWIDEIFNSSRSNFHWWERGGFGWNGENDRRHVLRWRGAARTAIVDVPEELSMVIPAFNSEAYFYTDENGNDQEIKGSSPTNRIDLLFVYSKPVDASSSYIGEYKNDTFNHPGDPTKITKAQLGIVYGAGIGMSFQKIDRPIIPTSKTIIDLQDEDGKHLMLPNAADQLMTDAGFTKLGVHGSFPAPDDLMNISPLLAEDLETDNPMLIGQSILPLAYIVTTNADSLNAKGATILGEDSIIDIRPFLRTTELAYNERAGIAAAMPQISFSNPAVGKAQLDREMMRAKEYIDREVATHAGTKHGGGGTTIINKGGGGGAFGTSAFPRVVGSGYVFGGALFGPEAVLWHYFSTADRGSQQAGTDITIKDKIKEFTSLPSDTVIPDYPQWDPAMWSEGLTNRGKFPADWIQNHMSWTNENWGDTDKSMSYGCVLNAAYGPPDTGMARTFALGANAQWDEETAELFFVKKTIPINTDGVGDWMMDYNVKVELENCVGHSNNAGLGGGVGYVSQVQGVWVEKKKKEFTIFVAWVGKCSQWIHRSDNSGLGRDHRNGPWGKGTVLGNEGWNMPYNNRTARFYASFAVLNTNFLGKKEHAKDPFRGNAQAGACIYPTVSYTVVGIPHAFGGHAGDGLGEGGTLYLV